MTEAAAGITGLLASAIAAVSITEATALRAVAGNVTDLTTLIAFLTTSVTIACLRAFTGDMPSGTATVARLFLRGYSALATYWMPTISETWMVYRRCEVTY